MNTRRHGAALRPFRAGEFGPAPAAPREAHRKAVNRLIGQLREAIFRWQRRFAAASSAVRGSSGAKLSRVLALAEQVQRLVNSAEQIWDFYHELFRERQSPAGRRLFACDRIGRSCYQAVYTALGEARSVPSPDPFSFLDWGTAATFRRGVSMTRLARRANPFPLIKVPFHHLVNPWSLGAVPHEVAHNLQADLGLRRPIPRAVARRLARQGVPSRIAQLYAKWHSETFADLCGQLLAGPTVVASLLEVLARAPRHAVKLDPRDVHPPPYLRVFVNLDLLRKTGFGRRADSFLSIWRRLFPLRLLRALPTAIRDTFEEARRALVDTICFKSYRQLGRRSLVEVVRFRPQDEAMTREAAERLASGTDPGIIPERFLIGASRAALERRLVQPAVITKNFYVALAGR